MGSSVPAICFVTAFLLLLFIHFRNEGDDKARPIASQGRIAYIILNECPMLGHFVSVRALAKRHNFDYEALECVVDDFVRYGMLERKYKKRGRFSEVEFYRYRVTKLVESPSII